MNRSKVNQKSVPEKAVAGPSAKLPPHGREKIQGKKSGSLEPGISSATSNGSTDSRGKKKKSSFFSNLFKSKIPEDKSQDVDGVVSSTSYESLASTNSFTFVSSKKFKRKGQKGKRIPVDDATLPRPNSNFSDNNNSRTESVGGGTLGRDSKNGGGKKLGTLGRIGIKMGLKKKYNLQSCESLEHISSLPRSSGKKGQGKVNVAVSPRSSVIIEGEGNETVQNVSMEESVNIIPTSLPEEPNPSTSKATIDNREPEKCSPLAAHLEKSDKAESERKQREEINSPNIKISPEPTPSTSANQRSITPHGLSLSGYTSDSSTWSSSTRRKRRAPLPPSKSGQNSTIDRNYSGSTVAEDDENGERNVELMSVKRLDENNEFLERKKEGKVNYPSYPSGALRRNKSKEKSHNRPNSCTCSNSIFAHHSKYQQFHKCCSDGPHSHGSANKCANPNYNTSSMTRAHVKGKKKAPGPPLNPFECPEVEPVANSSRNLENPYGNPFLDEEVSNSQAQVSVALTKENNSIQILNGDPSPINDHLNDASTRHIEIVSTSVAATSETNSVVSQPTAITSENVTTTPSETFTTLSTDTTPISSQATQFVPTDEEIAQNMLNDSQEQEQLACVQNTINSPPPEVATTSSPTAELSPINSKSSNNPTPSNSKRLFNFSRNRNSNSHLKEENKNEFEQLLNSSATLMAQAREVDDQVKAQLVVPAKKEKDGKLQNFFSKSKKNTLLEITPSNNNVAGSLTPPLSPRSPTFSDEDKAAPRPWYKRGSSVSKSPSGTKAKPSLKHTFTHLPKFSDLDREAKKIVEENKRKSAEIAFNQNARDLIDIFNTSFNSSSNTTPSSRTDNPDYSSSTTTVGVTSSDSLYTPTISSSFSPTPTSTSLLTNSSNVAVVQPHKSISTTSVTSSKPVLLTTSDSSRGLTISTTSVSVSPSVQTGTSFPVNSSQTNKVAPSSSVTPVDKPISKFTPKAFEDWHCPRCTLKNPSWKALCEACYYRKFSSSVLSPSSSSYLEKTSPKSATNNTTSQTTLTPTTNSVFISKPGLKAITSEVSNTAKPNQASQNLLSEHPSKKDLAKNEKLQEIDKINKTADNNLQDGEDVDVKKLRQARLAFFAKDQQNNEQSLNINVNNNEDSTPSTPSPISNTNIAKNPQTKNAFKDGENSFIDKLLFSSKNDEIAPKRPPKPGAESPVYEPGPNFKVLLPQQSTNTFPQSNSHLSQSPQFYLHPLSPQPTLAYRPFLAPISETDSNYYSIQDICHLYENWQSSPSVENESLHSPTNHLNFNSCSNNIANSNTNAAHPLMPPLQMRQHIANIPDSPTLANFRTFTPITPIQNSISTGFDPGSAFASNSHFLSSGFTSESETEVDLDMDRHHRRHGHNRERYFNSGGSSYSGERHLSYDDYRRLGAIPKGYAYSGSSSDHDERRFGSGSGSRRPSGLNSFRNQDLEPSRYYGEPSENSVGENPTAVSKLLRKLEWAIAQGEHRLASSLAHDLALLKVNCVVAKPDSEPITIRVYVEDRFMQQGPFLVQILLTMTLKDLKSKIEGDWMIPASFQKWILGKKMGEDDNETLANYDVIQETMAFLYLVTPQIENLGAKVKEISPPPPPLPKKPTSPSVSRPVSQIETSSTAQNPSPQTHQQTNQLKNSMAGQTSPRLPIASSSSPKVGVQKVASSCQTESIAATGSIIKKPPMPEPGKSPSPIHLYERPPSPSREEKSATTEPQKIDLVPQQANKPLNSGSTPSNLRSTTPTLLPNPVVDQRRISSPTKEASSVPLSSQNISSPNRKSPVPIASNFPMSLQAKLANLRLAAEQAFGKSFGQQLASSDSPPPNAKTQKPITTNSQPKSSTPVPVKEKVLNSSPKKGQNREVKTQGSPRINQGRKVKVSEIQTKPQQSFSKANKIPNEVAEISKTNILHDEGRKEEQAKTFISKEKSQDSKEIYIEAKDVSTTELVISEPTPTPRLKKLATPEIFLDAESFNNVASEETINVKISEAKKNDQEDKILNTKFRVEGSCQTTLPFPSSSKSKPLETPPTNDSTTLITDSNQPTASTSPNQKKTSQNHESTVIVANVMITPFINHALLGATALLQGALSPMSYSRPQNRVCTSPNNSNTNMVTPPKALTPTTTTATIDKTDILLSPLTSSQLSTLPLTAPVILRNPTKNKAKTKSNHQLPYFMRQEPPSISTTPSKVKMIAEKFNKPDSTTPSSFLQRKNSDGSTINLANSLQVKPNQQVQGSAELSVDKKESNIQTYLNMLKMMENQDLIMCNQEFECPVCFGPVPSEAGVTLRDCLHNFCKDCLIGAVQYADESEVKCPFRDNSYSCNSSLQEREIKALVSSELWEKYLTRSVKLAERKMMNTFHCSTNDCTGWCIFEEDVNIFKCPVCKKKNCITCATIHDGMDCQQYQRQLAIAAETDEDAKSSRLMLEKMIQRGEALECPACHVVLLKKWGCDWVKCSYCKTEICWVTKGLRWGPGGKGDLSGGCKCGLNGIRCHPKCTYCH